MGLLLFFGGYFWSKLFSCSFLSKYSCNTGSMEEVDAALAQDCAAHLDMILCGAEL